MPYTEEQLQNNEYFQNLKLEAKREYEDEFNDALNSFAVSSSMDGNMQLLRAGNHPQGAIQSYEDPETGSAQDHPNTWVRISRKQDKLKRGEALAEIIDRDFLELT
tara:strand:+ start:459 stop:776 length:318 start_codon:yes stop_codon:yes gene_type:complete